MTTAITADLKTIARRWNEELFNANGRIETAHEFVAADFLDHSGPPWQPAGIEGVYWIANVFRTAFPDIYSNVEDVIVEGDKAVVRFSAGGTHLGELFGIPATGKAGTLTGIHIFRIADGKIAEHWGNSDDLGMMQQLGVIPG
jgi:steroid delta-isomerase-like uncharacterized protein